MLEAVEDEPEKMRKMQYFVILYHFMNIKCEVPDYTTSETLLIKSIDNFNEQMAEEGSIIRLSEDVSMYSLRIAKKKSGKPNTDYPSKLRFLNLLSLNQSSSLAQYLNS